MDLLIAIREYIAALNKYGFYPKTKKPSLGKLEKMADLCMDGKIRKLSRYIPEDVSKEQDEELTSLLQKIEEIVKNEKENN